MDKTLEKALRVSDGVASLVHKKVAALVKDLQREGALTAAESQKVLKGLGKAKKSLYDDVSGELKKVLSKKGKPAKQNSVKKRK